MIRVVLLGQPVWSMRFEAMLNELRPELDARFVPLRSLLKPSALRACLRADVLLRMGYRPGARTLRGRLFDGLWALLRTLNSSAKAVHYWIGTDVLNTLEDFRAGRLRPGPMARATEDLHWADAPWLVTELAEVGLASEYIALPVPLKDVRVAERFPDPFTVLTYIPDVRAEFYDGPSIHRCAEALPEVRFHVIGGEGKWVEKPLPNLRFLGWQKDVRPMLMQAAVLVRLVRHDGMGGTVREALESGLHVIYSQPMPCVNVVPFQDPAALEAAVRELLRKFQAGELSPNHEGRRYVRENFDFDTCLDFYLSGFRRLLGDHGNNRSIPGEVRS